MPVLLLAGVLSLSGCGGTSQAKADPSASSSASPSPAAPTPSVPVPSGVTLTAPGTKLSFGQTATVPYEPNDKRASVLALTVTSATRASLKDFAAYVLDNRTRASTPYYVHVAVKNVGTGDVGGTDVPLWAVDQHNVLIHSSSFTNAFTRCPSPTLPKHFGPAATLKTCLVYLVPNGGTMTSASFRPLQAFDPIVWTGTIGSPHQHKAKGHPAKGHPKAGKKKS